MCMRPWEERVEAVNRYAYDCYLDLIAGVLSEAKSRTDITGYGGNNAKARDRQNSSAKAAQNELLSDFLSEAGRRLFEQFVKHGFFEFIENYYLVDYGTYAETYVFHFGPDPKKVFAVDITDVREQITRSMSDYVKSIQVNTLGRISKNGRPYTVTLFGILNCKLLRNRNGYAYCAATGGNFREYRQFDRDLAIFGRYVKEKAEVAERDGVIYIGENVKYGRKEFENSANKPIPYVLSDFSNDDYTALRNRIDRGKRYRGYIDELKTAYTSRLTEPIIEYENGAANIDKMQVRDDFEEFEGDSDGQYEKIEDYLSWINSLVFYGKKRNVYPYLITTVLTRMLLGLHSDMRLRSTSWSYEFCIHKLLYDDIKNLMMDKEQALDMKDRLRSTLYNDTEEPPYSDVDLNEVKLCCGYPAIFNAQFTLDMLAAGRIAGKPVIAKLSGVTEPTVDSTVEEFVVRMDEYRERNRRRFIDK